MNEPTTLGAYLKRERERRGLSLRTISESTKVSVPLLEGLEADDISRWPGGIFRRAFVRSYAQCVGLDPNDVVRRFERQHSTQPDPILADPLAAVATAAQPRQPEAGAQVGGAKPLQQQRIRLLGTAADLTVALILAFGSAAAGSRLLWPVMLIAAYYAAGVLLTGTSPMVALLDDQAVSVPPPRQEAPAPGPARPGGERRQHRRTHERPRQRRGSQVRAQ
jgi:hypothetical protein